VRIERPVADESLDGAGSGSWELVQDDVAAEVEDMLPSRGERLATGINVTTRPARVRLRFRDDITSSMRFVVGDRIMQITAGPAKLGRDAIEFMVEDYSAAGNPA
jgi:head-tail adaptor